MDWKDIASVDLPSGTQIGDLLGLVDQLEAQAKAVLSPHRSEGVPHVRALDPLVAEAHADLLEGRDRLRAAEAKRVASVPAGSDDDTVVANDHADDAWRSLQSLLEAGRTLVDSVRPGRAEAEALHQRLFGKGTGGVGFINYRARRQWDVAQKHVAILDEPGVVATIEALGGARYLKAVKKTHREFGVAFGFLQASELLPDAVTNTRAEQLALQAAVREYLVKVTSRVSKRDPASVALARFLLQPYSAMVEDLARTPRAVKKPVAPAPPAGGGQPTT
jgi:hypothetical protein